jgi:hypothetical protein
MISSALGQVVGINEQYSVWSAIALVPIFLWELTLGLRLVFKGFDRTAPLMVAAAAEATGANGSPTAVRPSVGAATTAGAA